MKVTFPETFYTENWKLSKKQEKRLCVNDSVLMDFFMQKMPT